MDATGAKRRVALVWHQGRGTAQAPLGFGVTTGDTRTPYIHTIQCSVCSVELLPPGGWLKINVNCLKLHHAFASASARGTPEIDAAGAGGGGGARGAEGAGCFQTPAQRSCNNRNTISSSSVARSLARASFLCFLLYPSNPSATFFFSHLQFR